MEAPVAISALSLFKYSIELFKFRLPAVSNGPVPTCWPPPLVGQSLNVTRCHISPTLPLINFNFTFRYQLDVVYLSKSAKISPRLH